LKDLYNRWNFLRHHFQKASPLLQL
jgi:hypothetical protein